MRVGGPKEFWAAGSGTRPPWVAGNGRYRVSHCAPGFDAISRQAVTAPDALLPVQHRITKPYKLAVLIYKVRSTSTPVYVHSRITERVCHPTAGPAVDQDRLFQSQPHQVASTCTEFGDCQRIFSYRAARHQTNGAFRLYRSAHSSA